MSLNAIQIHLEQIGQLPANWDHEGARAVRPECVTLARTLADALAASQLPAPAVVPSYDGGIIFLWDNDVLDLELMIETEDSIRYTLLVCATGDESDGTIAADNPATLQELARTLAAWLQPTRCGALAHEAAQDAACEVPPTYDTRCLSHYEVNGQVTEYRY